MISISAAAACVKPADLTRRQPPQRNVPVASCSAVCRASRVNRLVMAHSRSSSVCVCIAWWVSILLIVNASSECCGVAVRMTRLRDRWPTTRAGCDESEETQHASGHVQFTVMNVSSNSSPRLSTCHDQISHCFAVSEGLVCYAAKSY